MQIVYRILSIFLNTGLGLMVEIICYHTCKNKNGKDYILQRAPFHSDRSKPQWLGQGYYLWTDSDFYAHRWIESDYVIIKAKVEVGEEEFLDLVGNVNAQLFFEKLISAYKEYLRKKISECKRQDKDRLEREYRSLSISDVIRHYRSERKFPFKVVKAQDIHSEETKQTRFVRDRNEFFLYPTRQQLVVYTEASNLIKYKEWYFPKD